MSSPTFTWLLNALSGRRLWLNLGNAWQGGVFLPGMVQHVGVGLFTQAKRHQIANKIIAIKHCAVCAEVCLLQLDNYNLSVGSE